MNQISILGRITKEIELKMSQGGKSYTKFSVAVPRKLDKDTSDFFNVTLFGKTAEAVAKWTGKGKRIQVTGAMQMNKTDKGTFWDLVGHEVNIIDFLEKDGNPSKKEAEEYPF